MKKISILFFLVGMIFSILSCEKNNSPEIVEIISNPDIGPENSTFSLTALCQDSDGDHLSYIWVSSSGQFLSPDDQFKVSWVAPEVVSDTIITISLHINDGFGLVSRNKSINVTDVLTELYVTTSSIINITHVSAESGGVIEIEGDDEVTNRGVCWSVNESPTILNNRTIDGSGGGAYVSDISGLLPGTRYFVRAYALCGEQVTYGEQLSFKTDGGNQDSDGSFVDVRDDHEYKWKRIGEQVWMQENMAWLPDVSPPTNGSKYSNMYYVQGYYGDSRTQAKNHENYRVYGVLYNWPASLNACPAGWHLPSFAEWDVLFEYLGGKDLAGGLMKESGLDHWINPNYRASNSSGFTALPAGDRSIWPDFYYLGETAFFWSSDEFDDSAGNSLSLHHEDQAIRPYPWNKAYGFSVRCLQDN